MNFNELKQKQSSAETAKDRILHITSQSRLEYENSLLREYLTEFSEKYEKLNKDLNNTALRVEKNCETLKKSVKEYSEKMNNNVGNLKNSNEKLSEEIESTVKAWSDELNQIMDITVRDFHKTTYTAIDDYKKKVSEFEKISKSYMNKHEKFYKTLYFFMFVVIILLVGVLVKLLFF